MINFYGNINIDEIVIKKPFLESIPKQKKIDKCRDYWIKNHRQDRDIILNSNYELVDGYIQYLILKEFDIENAIIKVSNKVRKHDYRKEITTYVYGVHPNSICQKEYVWRVPITWNMSDLLPGDMILCKTKYGISPVIVTKVEVLKNCPINSVVKKVASKKIYRNGVEI